MILLKPKEMRSLWFFILILVLGCDERAGFPGPSKGSDRGSAAQLPTVNTGGIVSITEISAIANGSVSYTGGVSLIAGGVCYSTKPGPTIANDRTDIVISPGVTGAGPFKLELFDLVNDTTYYVRAFAVNYAGTAYGHEVRFRTR